MQEFEVKQRKLDYSVKEAFKTLRTNIEFSGDNIKVVAITSATPGEGKSSTAFELAQTFAQDGKRTLLIDADLRRSVMKSRYKKGKIKYGFVNYLVGQKNFTDVLCTTDVPNFYMVFSGPIPPNPSELLGNNRFISCVEECAKSFDMVIIDTPPIGSVVDAAVISKMCDGMIVVMESGAISYPFARKIKAQLEKANVKVLGVVLNKVNFKKSSYYGKYYGKYYGRYYGKYGEENDKK